MDPKEKLEKNWRIDRRWLGVVRPYSAESVLKLRGNIRVEHTFARLGAKKLWQLFKEKPFMRTMGALTGHQAVQMAQAGLEAIYVSGWQVAADNNAAKQTYPDQSLYPANSVPELVRRINNALKREDEKQSARGENSKDWLVPIVADAEAGFGGALNAFELMKAMIEAGAAGVHFEDQLGSEKKCGHLGGKVLVPTSQFIRTLNAARLAADVLGIPTVLIARTDANAATLLTSEIDDRDKPFIIGKYYNGKEMTYREAFTQLFVDKWDERGVRRGIHEGNWYPLRTPEGYYRVKAGLTQAIARGLSYAPYADMIWCETAKPDLKEAEEFAKGIHEKYPDKPLMYNCSPSFNWKQKLSDQEIAVFHEELGRMGYKFNFITLAGWHDLNNEMFELASAYAKEGMSAYVRLQQKEFENEKLGYKAVKHQEFVGTSYFDEVARVISGGESSTTAMDGSTEKEQFS